MIKNNRSAFTLAEMMIVMLILTILLAAFAPLMTKKAKVDLSNPWRWAANNSDLYFGIGNNQSAMLGQNGIAMNDPHAKLLINSSNGLTNPHITFKEDNDIRGHLIFRDSNLFLGTRTDVNNGIPNLKGTNNIAIGRDVLKDEDGSVGSTNNVAIGSNVLATNHVKEWLGVTLGTGNVAIGQNVLSDNYGYNNVALGHNIVVTPKTTVVDDTLVTSSNTIAIGNNINMTDIVNNAIILGQNLAVSKNLAGAIVLGKTCSKYTPPSGHHITGCVGSSGEVNNSTGTVTGGHFFVADSGDTVHLGGFASEIYLYKYKLFDSWGRLQETSDKRLKNIGKVNNYGLDILRKLTVYNFTWKDDKTKTPQIGVIAQDVQKQIPEAVSKNDKGFLTINKDYIEFSMLNAIKELDKMVQDLVAQVKTIAAQVKEHDTQIKALQKENKELKSKVNNLEKRLNALEKKL